MSSQKCPGQDPMFMKAHDIAEVECPECGHVVEFWPDELMRRCRRCGHRFVNPENSLKCLEWCRYASECMAALREGDDSWVGPLRDEIVERMKAAFGGDEGRAGHALAVLRVSEKLEMELGADPLVLEPAAILHDIGRAASFGGSDSDHGEAGRRGAAEVLGDLGLPAAVREQILTLIERHHDRSAMQAAGPNGQALFDADLIVNLREAGRPDGLEVLEREALTAAGRRIGRAALTLPGAGVSSRDTPDPAGSRGREERAVDSTARQLEGEAAPRESLADLMTRIERQHHVLLRREVPRLQALVRQALGAPRSRYGGVFRALGEELARFWFDFEQHLRKEEEVLFPFIRSLECFAREGGDAPEGNPQEVAELKHEHESALDRLQRIRRLSANYALPDDADPVLAELYGGLQAVEDDMNHHVELEDGILVPRALALARRLLGSGTPPAPGDGF